MFLIRDLVSPRTWLAFTHHLAGWVVGVVFFLIVAFGIAIGLGSLPLALAGLPVLGLTLRCADWLAAEERARFAVLLGVRIPAWPADPRRGYRWLLVPRRATLTGRQTWGTVGYGLLEVVVATVNLVLCLAVWAFGLVMVTLPLYSGLLPGGSATIGGTALRGPLWLAASVAAGVLVLLAAPQLTRGLAVADAAFARRLLAPPRDLAARVTELERSRERVVDAAEAERRRIERDLHDGAQQRLVALAMELGRAKTKFADDVDAARDLVDQAHAEAKAALTELRNLVRGVHPPVLTDRGLDAALSGLAALCPVPVDVQVDVPVRPKAGRRGGRVLRRRRGAHERREALPRQPRDRGRGGARLSGHAQRGDQRRRHRRGRRGRRGPGRPGRPGSRCRRHPVGRVPVRRPDDHLGGAAMRVAIAEDSVLLREGLTRLLAEAGHEVVATAGDAEGFLRAVAASKPDACVVDVRMPPTFTDEGLRAALVVRDRWPDIGVLVLSQWVEERYATELIAGRPHGVGYLLKDRVADVTEFLDALRRVAEGGSALDPEVVAQLLARSRHPLGDLTPREREVLALMAEGRSNSAIAESLVVGSGAVEKHINNIFTKLGLAPGERDHRRVLAVLRYLGTG